MRLNISEAFSVSVKCILLYFKCTTWSTHLQVYAGCVGKDLHCKFPKYYCFYGKTCTDMMGIIVLHKC